MSQKVRRHITQRGAQWTTIEEPLDVAEVLPRLADGDVVLMECATMWLSNHLMSEHDLEAQTDRLLVAIENCPADVVVVTNETGLGIVPENALARRFREAQGRLNLALAAQADCVVFVTAGLSQVLKGAL